MEYEKKSAEKILNGYIVNESRSKLEELRGLDRKVKLPAKITAYTLGIGGSLVLGTGMCLAMKVIGNLMPLGVVIGILGIAIVSANYFIYKAIMKSRKKKYAPRILALSREIIKE